jgi:hypothetical protein
MKAKSYKTIDEVGSALGFSRGRVAISKMKTKLKKSIIKEAKSMGLSASDLAADVEI